LMPATTCHLVPFTCLLPLCKSLQVRLIQIMLLR
jgi:hypothetical protein